MKPNTLYIILVTLLVGAGAYWYFFVQSSSQPSLTEVAATDGGAQTKFQTLVSQLRGISFNTAILSDPKFTSLVDITTPVAPEASGRLDPFAPVPGVTGQ